MKTFIASPSFPMFFGRSFSFWLLALAALGLILERSAHAQTHVINNPNGSTTIHSTVGGPGGVSLTFGGKTPPTTPSYWSPTNPHGTVMPLSQLRYVPMEFGPAIAPPPANPYWSPTNPNGTVMPLSQLRHVPMQFGPAIPPPPANPYWSPTNPNGTVMPLGQLRHVR